MRESLPYRPNVCMLVYNRERKIFIGRRRDEEVWQFPQGGVDSGHSPLESVYKELEEELGLRPESLGRVTQLQATHCYDFAQIPHRWRNRWRGQEQTFWAVEFVGRDEDINLTRDRHPEFSAWRWCQPEAIEESVDPVRRPGYRQPVQELLEL